MKNFFSELFDLLIIFSVFAVPLGLVGFGIYYIVKSSEEHRLNTAEQICSIAGSKIKVKKINNMMFCFVPIEKVN